MFVKVPLDAPKHKKLDEWIRKKDIKKLRSYCSRFAETYSIEDSVWLNFNDVLKYTPFNEIIVNEVQFLKNKDYIEMSIQMIKQVGQLIESDPQYLCNWIILYSYLIKPTAEIAIVGQDLEKFRLELEKKYYPNKIVVGTIKESELPLLKERTTQNEYTTLYVCYDKTCKLPVKTVKDALQQLE